MSAAIGGGGWDKTGSGPLMCLLCRWVVVAKLGGVSWQGGGGGGDGGSGGTNNSIFLL